MNVELIAIDLDDTLLRADLTISEGNKRALREAAGRGIRVVLSSGRNLYSMRHYAEDIGILGPGDYMICSNGAEIVHALSGRVLDEQRLDPQLCRDVAREIESRGFPWQIYEEGIIHVSRPNSGALLDAKLTGQPVILVEDREAFFARGLLKFVVPGSPEDIARLLPELKASLSGRANVLTSKPYFLEVLSLEADKGLGLKRLAAMVDLPLERIMAIGDAMNDLGMLQAAGIGCAPANAIPEVKAAVGFVSGRTNEEDAVADLVERLALGRA